MIYDAHIHLMPDTGSQTSISPETYYERVSSIGVGGGAIFSFPPSNDRTYERASGTPDNKARVAHVLDFCSKLPDSFYPFYWIDPTEPDAVEQVIYAKEQGIRGFKVLCSYYYPEQGRAAYAKAAELNLPVLFHSGILWDGATSSHFNRPLNFEFLQEIPKLRFSLAHMSWPWCDECIALFGKVLNTQNHWSNGAEMFVDCSPGAPEYDRREAFRKMALIGYGFEDRLMWAIDAEANHFRPQWGANVLKFDRQVFEELHQRYSDPAVMDRELGFLRMNRKTLDFREFFRKATEVNFLRFLNGAK